MAKKKNKAPESPQEIVLTLKPWEEPEASADDITPVQYRVSCPTGIYLRMGPGKAYCTVSVLPCGTEVWTVDQDNCLRSDRLPDDTAWVNVVTKDGTGWVDRAFLERANE